MEKSFHRMVARASARHAYVEAEVITGLAHQIRSIRFQRGWTQSELAKRLGTTQAAVSRLEDPSYGRFSLKTLIDLAKVFDTGMQVRFVSLVTMLSETFMPHAAVRNVPSFEDQAATVGFFKESLSTPGSHYVSIDGCATGHAPPVLSLQFPQSIPMQIPIFLVTQRASSSRS